MRPSHAAAIGLVLLTLLVAASPVRRKEIDYDALEKAWQSDDDPREVRSSADDQFDRLDAMSQADAKAHGPQMLFVTLRTEEPLSELASRWKEVLYLIMLWNGGVEVNIYEIESSKILVGLQKGLLVTELQKFLKEQPELVQFDWNDRTYTRDGEETAGSRPTRKKMLAKKRSKKAKRASLEERATDEL